MPRPDPARKTFRDVTSSREDAKQFLVAFEEAALRQLDATVARQKRCAKGGMMTPHVFEVHGAKFSIDSSNDRAMTHENHSSANLEGRVSYGRGTRRILFSRIFEDVGPPRSGASPCVG
jgi:hypothetical protein